MANYGKSGAGKRVALLFLLDAFILLGGLLWFDALGIVDMKWLFNPVYSLFGLQTRNSLGLASDDPALLDSERLAKQVEALDIRDQELSAKEADLQKREADIDQKAQTLDEREKALEDKQNSFNQSVAEIENRKANVAQLAKYLTGQDPKKAVPELLEHDDQMVIDICREVEKQAQAEGNTSIVSYWFSLMPPARAAQIQGKMAEKPTSLDTGQ
jgi:flagellar protein FlbB